MGSVQMCSGLYILRMESESCQTGLCYVMPPQDGASIGNTILQSKNKKLLVRNWISESIG